MNWNLTTDNWGIDRCEVRVTRSGFAATFEAQPWQSSLTVNGLAPNLSYDVRLIAIDLAGNETNGAPKSVVTVQF